MEMVETSDSPPRISTLGSEPGGVCGRRFHIFSSFMGHPWQELARSVEAAVEAAVVAPV